VNPKQLASLPIPATQLQKFHWVDLARYPELQIKLEEVVREYYRLEKERFSKKQKQLGV